MNKLDNFVFPKVRLLKKGGMKWMEHFMAGLMCFGGGVLLATVFIHMLPEVSENLIPNLPYFLVSFFYLM
jgi:hypothetical protein